MQKFGHVLSKFWKLLGIAILALSAFLSHPAYSFTPIKHSEVVKISFSKNSSTLSDSTKITLARHLPRLFSLHLENVVIIADGDAPGSSTNDQISLAKARATTLRQFFIDAGVPGEQIYSVTKLSEHGNASVLEYVGTCTGGDTACPYCVSETTLICR